LDTMRWWYQIIFILSTRNHYHWK